MTWLKRVIGALVVLALLLAVAGALLPGQWRVERSVVVRAAPERLYPLVASPHRWREWSVWTRRDPAMRIEYFGPESGAGAGWQWDSRTEGQGRMTLTRADPATGLAYDLFFPDLGSTSHGELRFEPADGGTRVTWTNEGDMGRNPFLHFLAAAMDRLVGPDFEAGLAQLRRLAEAP